MTIKTRISITNMLTVLASMISLLLIGSLLMSVTRNQFYDRNNVRLNPHTKQVEAALMDNLPISDLTNILFSYDFRLVVFYQDSVVFSNASPFQERLTMMGHLDEIAPNRTEYLQIDGITMVAIKKGQSIYVAASKPVFHPWGLEGKTKFEEYFWRFIFLNGLAIVIILLINYHIAKRLTNRIMKPVNALADGARRVATGDLSLPVAYDGNDEMRPVVSAFNEMQEKLLEEKEKNTVYEKAKTDLIAGISHDLRTPLTSVKGYIKGLQDGVANTPEKQERYLNIAYQKSCDMDMLLQKLFDLSQLETNNLPLHKSSQDLGDFLRQFANNIEEELQQKNVTVELHENTTTCPVNIDTSQFLRVLSNLTNNALSHAKQSPLTLSLTVWCDNANVHMTFADNGVGVAEENVPFLFDEFWKEDQARSSKKGTGTGLGLYIVKHIVELHDGSIVARNDNGLCFEITLPRKESQAHE